MWRSRGRRRRGPTWATLCLLVLGGTITACEGLASDPQPDASLAPAKSGAYLNCGGPAMPSPLASYKYDINDDGFIDRFVAMRCPRGKHDQLEVFTGKSPEDRPERLGGENARPPVHLQDHLNLAYGCLMFSDRTVLIGVGEDDRDASVAKLVLIGHWNPQRNEVEMVDVTDRDLAIPCAIVPRAKG